MLRFVNCNASSGANVWEHQIWHRWLAKMIREVGRSQTLMVVTSYTVLTINGAWLSAYRTAEVRECEVTGVAECCYPMVPLVFHRCVSFLVQAARGRRASEEHPAYWNDRWCTEAFWGFPLLRCTGSLPLGGRQSHR